MPHVGQRVATELAVRSPARGSDDRRVGAPGALLPHPQPFHGHLDRLEVELTGWYVVVHPGPHRTVGIDVLVGTAVPPGDDVVAGRVHRRRGRRQREQQVVLHVHAPEAQGGRERHGRRRHGPGRRTPRRTRSCAPRRSSGGWPRRGGPDPRHGGGDRAAPRSRGPPGACCPAGSSRARRPPTTAPSTIATRAWCAGSQGLRHARSSGAYGRRRARAGPGARLLLGLPERPHRDLVARVHLLDLHADT